MSEFVPVAREDEVPVGEVKVVHAQDKSLALGHCKDGTWGAIDNVCTHDGGVLGEGENKMLNTLSSPTFFRVFEKKDLRSVPIN